MRRTSVHAVRSAVETDAAGRATFVYNGAVVGVVNDGGIHVRDVPVVEVAVAAPVATVKTFTGVAESIVDAAVETDDISPVTRVPNIEAVRKTPIARSPEKAHARREHPNARNPVVAVIAIGPVAWLPDVTGPGAEGLRVNRKDRRGDPDGNANADIGSAVCDGGGRHGQKKRKR